MVRSFKPGRLGFTLIELLVVMAIIAVLVGILVPAVQKVREAANRTTCINNVKQIGLAILNFESGQRKLPSAGEGLDPANKAGKSYDLHSPLTYLLPFIEQNQVYKAMDLTKPYNHPVNQAAAQTNIPTYLCPSAEGLQADPGGFGQSSYMIISYTDITPTGDRDVAGSVGPFNKAGTPGKFGWRAEGAMKIYGASGSVYSAAGVQFPLSTVPQYKQNAGTIGNCSDGTSNTIILTEDSSYRNHRSLFPYQASSAADIYWVTILGNATGTPDGNVADSLGFRALNRWAEPEGASNGISGPPYADPGKGAQYVAGYGGPWVNNTSSPIGGTGTGLGQCTWDQNNCGPNDEPFGPHGGVVTLFLDGHVGVMRDTAGMGGNGTTANLIWRLVVPNDGMAVDASEGF